MTDIAKPTNDAETHMAATLLLGASIKHDLGLLQSRINLLSSKFTKRDDYRSTLLLKVTFLITKMCIRLVARQPLQELVVELGDQLQEKRFAGRFGKRVFREVMEIWNPLRKKALCL